MVAQGLGLGIRAAPLVFKWSVAVLWAFSLQARAWATSGGGGGGGAGVWRWGGAGFTRLMRRGEEGGAILIHALTGPSGLRAHALKPRGGEAGRRWAKAGCQPIARS